MITLIEAMNYRCLRHVRQPLGPFHVLVGPNASGKSTFLDVLPFIGQLITEGTDVAVDSRTDDYEDLFWEHMGFPFELAIEAALPKGIAPEAASCDTIRYAVSLGSRSGQVAVLDEHLILKPRSQASSAGAEATSDASPLGLDHIRTTSPHVVRLGADTSDYLTRERGVFGFPSVREENQFRSIIPKLIALGSVQPGAQSDILKRSIAPVARAAEWLCDLLQRDTCLMSLEPKKLRALSPRGKGERPLPDGSNLPWVVQSLEEKAPDRFREWVRHLQTALPDVEGIRIVGRPDEGDKYIKLQYRGGLAVPSWMLSDGTLRLLALTILAYIPNPPNTQPIWLIEEPENSLHPLNIETVMQSLQSVYDGQVLVSTHSPLVLGVTKPENVLVFSRGEERGTQIVVGNEHPGLRDWHGEVDLGTLFASGVLG